MCPSYVNYWCPPDLRLDRLKSRKDSRVFADKWGPGMLAVGLFAVR